MIMMPKTLSLLLTCMYAWSTEGFAPRSFSKTSPVVNANVALLLADNENDAAFLLHKAEECALSDSCSVDDAKLFLREVVHLESGCAAGTLVGDNLCDDQAHVAEIVASLRAKVERGETTNLDAAQRAGVGMAVGSLALVVAIGMAARQQHDAIPFTAQEWWWAIQGGYLDTMVAHFIRNGGI